jgi:hypothetical protein
MSGAHFSVESGANGCSFRDLNSRHGTFLNGEKATEGTLHEGDQITAGQSTFVVHIVGTTPATGQLGEAEYQNALTAKFAQTEKLEGPPTFEPPTREPAVIESVEPASAPPVPEKPPEPIPQRPEPAVQERVSAAPSVATPTETPAPTRDVPALAPEKNDVLRALERSTEATPEGRLINILREQDGALFALLDAAREPKVQAMLPDCGEKYKSLYEGNAFAEVAPYLVHLPPTSKFLDKLVHDGWGQGWIVYLRCNLSLDGLRDYFRKSLMITMPDGREFFSRFYDPRFFRGFLRGCTAAEAERFFGPTSSYLMEAENPEILLEFTRSGKGVEVRERLLLLSGT